MADIRTHGEKNEDPPSSAVQATKGADIASIEDVIIQNDEATAVIARPDGMVSTVVFVRVGGGWYQSLFRTEDLGFSTTMPLQLKITFASEADLEAAKVQKLLQGIVYDKKEGALFQKDLKSLSVSLEFSLPMFPEGESPDLDGAYEMDDVIEKIERVPGVTGVDTSGMLGFGDEDEDEGLAGVGEVVPSRQSLAEDDGEEPSRESLAKVRLVEQDFSLFESALNAYRLNAGTFPSPDQGLEALHEKPTTGRIPKAWEPSLKSERLDPWGLPYGYRFPPAKNRGEPDIWSFGPDMIDGTEDDIGNWE
jgi:general secretion pathway protein G